jgi:prepilin signal peptidase PulO-like enzyme (type II secretory pathway)
MIYLIIFIFGAIWGSFAYTLALRYIDGSFTRDPFSALFSSSKTPCCEENISPFSLIPIISYIIIRGRCRKCKKRISPTYPLMEIFFGLILIVVLRKFGISPYSINIYLLISISIIITIIDFKILKIPNSLIVVFFILAISFVTIRIITVNIIITDHLYGFLFMLLFFITILLLFPGSFGGGDIKYASVIGFITGLEQSILSLEISLITGSIIGIIFLIKSKRNLKTKIPFAPFLSLGYILSLFYGDKIILIYYNIIY